MRSAVPVVPGGESFSAVDGVVLDLDLQVAFDQVAELGVQGGVIRIDAEQELLIAGVQERVSAQGGCVRLDGQITAEFIDAGPAEVSP